MGNEQSFARVGGTLVPTDEETREWMAGLKQGQAVTVTCRLPRNAAFHRKYFALLNLAFDYWSEAIEQGHREGTVAAIEYKGEPVLPNRERFRKDCIILAGFYRPVVNLKGEIRIEAESLKFGSMTEERFAKLYDATINVLLRRVFNGRICPKWSEEQLREVAERVLEFA